MKTGSNFWLAEPVLSGCLALVGLLACLLVAPSPGHAADWPAVAWESRYAEEKPDGDIIDHPPFVAVNEVRLRRFSEMQSVTFRDRLTIDHGDEGRERLYVFTVWQGGASQGEQLMLLSVRDDGVAVVGPHGQDFETLEIEMVNSESAPYFGLIGADGKRLGALEYFSGDLVEAIE